MFCHKFQSAINEQQGQWRYWAHLSILVLLCAPYKMRPLINDVFSFRFRQYAFEDKNSFGTTVSEEHWRTWESGRTVHALPKVIVTTKSNRCRSRSTTFFKANAKPGVYNYSVLSLGHISTWMKESEFPNNHCYKVSIHGGFARFPQHTGLFPTTWTVVLKRRQRNQSSVHER
jgi:hypothetical protein